MNSSWSRAYMEVVGTPLGGGALKLEATHLRRMLFPKLSNRARAKLHDLGRSLGQDTRENLRDIDQIVLTPFTSASEHSRTTTKLADDLRKLAHQLSSFRQRNS